MANIVEQTPNTAEKAISLLDNDQLDETTSKKMDYSCVRGKVIKVLNSLNTFSYYYCLPVKYFYGKCLKCEI